MKLKRNKQKKKLAATQERARQLLVSRKEKEALEFLEEAISVFPSDPELRLRYATILLAFRPEDVAKEAGKAVELGPNNPEILIGAGHRLLFGGHVEEARACAYRASDLVQPDFPLMPSLSNLRGLLAALDGDDDLAEKDLRSAVEGDPENEPFLRHLVVFLAERGRQRDALAVLDEGLKNFVNKQELELMRVRMTSEVEP